MDNPSRRTVGAGGWGLGAGGWGLGKDPARRSGVSSRDGLCSAPNPLGRSGGDASAAQRRSIFRGGRGILPLFADLSKHAGKSSYGAFTDQLKEKFEQAEGLACLKPFIQLLQSYPSPGSRPCAPSSSVLRMSEINRPGTNAPRPLVALQTPNGSSAALGLGPRPLPYRCVLGRRTTAPSDRNAAHVFFFFAAAAAAAASAAARLSSRFRSRLAGSKVAFAPPSGTGRRAQNGILAMIERSHPNVTQKRFKNPISQEDIQFPIGHSLRRRCCQFRFHSAGF
jgi:hypothetical protein